MQKNLIRGSVERIELPTFGLRFWCSPSCAILRAKVSPKETDERSRRTAHHGALSHIGVENLLGLEGNMRLGENTRCGRVSAHTDSLPALTMVALATVLLWGSGDVLQQDVAASGGIVRGDPDCP